MIKEIEQLRQIQRNHDVVSSLADKREGQYAQLAQNLGGESIERDIRIGEVMDRTMGRWHRLTEQAESLKQTLSEETAKINLQLERLRELSGNNPAITPVVKRYEEELGSLGTRDESISRPAEVQEPGEVEAISIFPAAQVPEQVREGRPQDRKPAAAPEKTRQAKAKRFKLELISGQEVGLASAKFVELARVIDQGISDSGELAKQLYNEDTDESRARIATRISKLNTQLLPYGLKVVNPVPAKARFHGVKARYSLVKIEALDASDRGKVPVRMDVPEIESQTQPKNVHEFTLPDGTIFTSPRNITVKVLGAVAAESGNTGSISKRVFGEVNNQRKGSIRSEISRLRKLLAKQGLGWTIERIETEGNISYELKSLNGFVSPEIAAGERIDGMTISQVPADVLDKPAQSADSESTLDLSSRPYVKGAVVDIYGKRDQVSVIQLASGQSVELKGGLGPELLRAIDSGISDVGELSRRIYGADNSVSRTRISAGIAALNKKLAEHSIIIRNIISRSDSNAGTPAHYVLEASQASDEVAASVSRATPRARAVEVTGFVEIVPYEPSPEEIRTEEETRIIVNILKGLTKSQRIYFDDLQRVLRTDARIEVKAGKPMYRLYQADEIKSLFESGLRKLREEASADKLRANWTEADKKAWDLIESQIMRNADGDSLEDYLRKVKKLIDEAARDFWGSKGAVHYIDVPHNGGSSNESR